MFAPGRPCRRPPGNGRRGRRLVKVLSQTVIPKEKLLGSGADLYFDTFASMGSGGGLATPPALLG